MVFNQLFILLLHYLSGGISKASLYYLIKVVFVFVVLPRFYLLELLSRSICYLNLFLSHFEGILFGQELRFFLLRVLVVCCCHICIRGGGCCGDGTIKHTNNLRVKLAVELSLFLELLQSKLLISVFKISPDLRYLRGIKKLGVVSKQMLFAKKPIYIPEVETLIPYLLVIKD